MATRRTMIRDSCREPANQCAYIIFEIRALSRDIALIIHRILLGLRTLIRRLDFGEPQVQETLLRASLPESV